MCRPGLNACTRNFARTFSPVGNLPAPDLPFADLSARYEASMGVVREALTRLTGEGLVESEPQYGFRVRALSATDLRHLTEARGEIETLVLRQAVEHGGLAWESEVLAAHHRLERTPQAAPEDPDRLSDDWAAAHATYHLVLLAGCPNPRLLGSRSRFATPPSSTAVVRAGWTTPTRDIPAEHRAILDAVLGHDLDAAAAALLARHIQRTTDILLDHAGSELDHEPTPPARLRPRPAIRATDAVS